MKDTDRNEIYQVTELSRQFQANDHGAEIGLQENSEHSLIIRLWFVKINFIFHSI